MKGISSSSNLERLNSEVKTLHTARPARLLFKRQLTVASLWEVQAKEIEVRSRLVEIRLSVSSNQSMLERCIKAVKTDVQARYRNQLRELGSTAGDRTAIVDRLLTEAVDLCSELESTLAIVDTVIKDIDQTAFGLRNATDLLKIALGPRASEATV